MRIDASGMGYRLLNARIREALAHGEKSITLRGVNGQRYICAGIQAKARVTIRGTPGNDLGAFMDGPAVEVFGNAQDGIANTMNDGRIVVHGNAGDVLAYAMRGGRLFIRGSVGYRVGIHMKAFRDLVPVLVIGGTAKDFLGEYMAGGVIAVLSLDGEGPPAGYGVGSGAHGGVIYVRGRLGADQLGREVQRVKMDARDRRVLDKCVGDFCAYFKVPKGPVMGSAFSKYVPTSHRPYGKLYAY